MGNTNNKTERREDRKVEVKLMNPIKRELRVNELTQKYLELKNQFIKGLMKVVEKYLIGMNRDGFQNTIDREFVQDSKISGVRIVSRFTNYGTGTMVITTRMSTEDNQYDDEVFGVVTEIKLSKELYSIMLKLGKVQDEINFHKTYTV